MYTSVPMLNSVFRRRIHGLTIRLLNITAIQNAHFTVFDALGIERAYTVKGTCAVYTVQAPGVHLGYNFGWMHHHVCQKFSDDMEVYALKNSL